MTTEKPPESAPSWPTTAAELRALRERYGHTQARAATIVGVAPNTWTRWETNQRPIDPHVARLYHLLGRRVWLMGYDEKGAFKRLSEHETVAKAREVGIERADRDRLYIIHVEGGMLVSFEPVIALWEQRFAWPESRPPTRRK